MADWPQSLPFNRIVLSSFSLLGPANGMNVSTIATGAWPAANRAIYLPFRLIYPFSVAKMFTIIGTDFSGSIDLGIYSHDGTRLVSSGIGTPTAINSIYSVDITDTTLGPGLYYMAMSNGIVGSFQRTAVGIRPMQNLGCLEQAGAHPLPSAAIFTATSANYFPVIAITSKTVI